MGTSFNAILHNPLPGQALYIVAFLSVDEFPNHDTHTHTHIVSPAIPPGFSQLLLGKNQLSLLLVGWGRTTCSIMTRAGGGGSGGGGRRSGGGHWYVLSVQDGGRAEMESLAKFEKEPPPEHWDGESGERGKGKGT